MKCLYLIPARGGSKGIPHKNIRRLGDKPLIGYSVDIARQMAADEDICVSTDDREILDAVKNMGLDVPFLRPEALATDTASTSDVICHALAFYENRGIHYDCTVLLQPTSPFRRASHIQEAMGMYGEDLDMVVSVKPAPVSVNLFYENENGYLSRVFKMTEGVRRQDAASLYEYNGSIYIINNESLLKKGMSGFTKIQKFIMSDLYSVDIDTELDWMFAEALLRREEFK